MLIKLTSKEKWKMLVVLYEHGADVKALKKVLPGYSEDAIKNVITRYRCRASRTRQQLSLMSKNGKQLQKLDLWIDYLKDCNAIKGNNQRKSKSRGHASLLSKTMLYAACFENHYQSNDPNEPNYSEIYRFLSQILSGEEPTQLRPGSAAKIIEMTEMLQKLVHKDSTNEYRQFLVNCPIESLLATTSRLSQEATKVSATGSGDEPGTFSQAHGIFEDMDDSDIEMDLAPDDPYYEVKKEKMFKKITEENFEIAKKVKDIPGLNPLDFPSSSLLHN